VRGTPLDPLLTSTPIDSRNLPFCKKDEVIDEAVQRLARL
jgi:hypothetical protein